MLSAVGEALFDKREIDRERYECRCLQWHVFSFISKNWKTATSLIEEKKFYHFV
jgi:nucleotidyltransferase/DNA polymerase involved in DNA repair